MISMTLLHCLLILLNSLGVIHTAALSSRDRFLADGIFMQRTVSLKMTCRLVALLVCDVEQVSSLLVVVTVENEWAEYSASSSSADMRQSSPVSQDGVISVECIVSE